MIVEQNNMLLLKESSILNDWFCVITKQMSHFPMDKTVNVNEDAIGP